MTIVNSRSDYVIYNSFEKDELLVQTEKDELTLGFFMMTEIEENFVY